MRRWSWLVVVLLLAAACGGDDPTEPADGPILTGPDAMPKQLATIVITPTATPVIAGGEAVSILPPTVTPGLPPSPTPQPTVYSGVFLGEQPGDGDEPVPTPAPYVADLGPGGSVISGGAGPLPGATGGLPADDPLGALLAANPTLQERLGQPVGAGGEVMMAAQRFERGTMYWHSASKMIYALVGSNTLFAAQDTWTDGQPDSDPGLVPPPGLIQPIRGFGKLWRSDLAIKDGLGWGVSGEMQHTGRWQDFERGALFVGMDGQIYALFPGERQFTGPLAPVAAAP